MEAFFIGKEQLVDILTKTYSRDVIVEYVHYLIDKEIPFSISLIDIDNFKYINDTYGHTVGDSVLQRVSAQISEFLSGVGGSIGRFGGDEFLLVLPRITEYDAVWKKCHELVALINKIVFSDISGLAITITMGVARYPENEKSYERLFEIADKALYRGKMKGRNCFIIYLPEKHANIVLKTEKDKSLSSMFLHASVFDFITKAERLGDGIESLFNFMSAYFMLDHICIQFQNKIYFDKLHQLAKNRDFAPIDERSILLNTNPSTGIFYVNQTSRLLQVNQSIFYNELAAQKIGALFCCAISCRERSFGFLRVDTTSPRIWQNPHMDILLSVARTIGILLYERNLSIPEL